MTTTPEGRRELKALPDVLDGHWTTTEGRHMAEFYAKQERKHLGRSDLSDFQLANAVFMADRSDLNLIVYQTAAKERIRWLSTQVAIITARAEASERREAGLREILQEFAAVYALHEDGDGNPCSIVARARAALTKSETPSDV